MGRDWSKLSKFLTKLLELLSEGGLTVAVVFMFIALEHSQPERKEFLKAVLAGLFALGVAHAWRSLYEIRNTLKPLTAKIEEIVGLVSTDERIIFAPRGQKEMHVIGVEPYDRTLNEHPRPQSGSDKWGNSISILAFDRMQDLIFSHQYLKHFFALREQSSKSNRILIVKDGARSLRAVSAFLEISQGLKINTYIYKASEFEKMLDDLRSLISPASELDEVRTILRGNPELNLMVDKPNDLVEWKAGRSPITLQQDYALRYLKPPDTLAVLGLANDQVPMRFIQLKRIFWILSAALNESRKGTDALHSLCNGGVNPANPWSGEHLQTWARSGWK